MSKSAEALAVTKLNKTLAQSSLDEFVNARAARSMLLVDCSSSMGNVVRSGERRIDALRKVVEMLRESHPVPVAAFHGSAGETFVEIVDDVPEPRGGTPLHDAIDFCTSKNATHLVVVTDGIPASETCALESARKFGGVIDVFYIGNGNDKGARFCQMLAKETGGTANVTDLGEIKLLHSKIAGLLPEASF